MHSRIKLHLLLFTSLIYSCSNESEIVNNSGDSINYKSDSAESFIKLQQNDSYNMMQTADITNITYSMESFYFNDTLKYFMCKAKIVETGTLANSHGTRKEKYEFFDYKLIKQFEINSKGRKIELQQNYYITHGLFTDAPRIFELNNYITNKAFVKSSGICWTAETPDKETVAYFGYQSTPPNNKLNQLGTFYFGINETQESEIRFYYESSQKYHSLVSFSLVPKNKQDKINFSNPNIRKLTLWSQNGNSGNKSITGFDILLKLRREKEHNNNQFENIEYIITVKDGKLYGNGLKQTTYGYQLILL